MPVESMLIRLMMGCVQPLVTPGICSFELSSLMMPSFVIPFRHSFFGFSKMMVSIMLIGELSVAVFALPALPSTCATSGKVLMILSCTCNNLLASELETSGKVTGINNKDPSSNGGINSEPSFVIITMPHINAIILIPITVFRHLRHHFKTGV